MRVTNWKTIPIFVFTDTVNKPVKIKDQKVIIKRTEEYYKTRTFDWRVE